MPLDESDKLRIIDNAINNDESTTLDFKRELYHSDKHHKLIKDVLSMANSFSNDDKFIICGVQENRGGKNNILGINPTNAPDIATYQQLIFNNIEPSIDLLFEILECEGRDIAVFIIKSKNQDKPYCMKKDHTGLKKGEIWIRKGTQQNLATREDIERMYSEKKRAFDTSKITAWFKGTNRDEKLILIAPKPYKLPSQIAEEKIKSILEKRERKRLETEADKRAQQYNLQRLTHPFGYVPYEQQTDLELRENLENVRRTYSEDDYWEVFGVHGVQIQVILKNNENQYLEDVLIEMEIPMDGTFLVADKKPEEPEHDRFRFLKNFSFPSSYPNVETERIKDKVVISNSIGNIRHGIENEAFKEPFIISLFPFAEPHKIECAFRIHAKNLEKSIEIPLFIEVQSSIEVDNKEKNNEDSP
ncbi:ATP-binding protein [bacterium]|nr:ATP-binding protein [bacterium]